MLITSHPKDSVLKLQNILNVARYNLHRFCSDTSVYVLLNSFWLNSLKNFFTQHKMAVIECECAARRSAHAQHTSLSELWESRYWSSLIMTSAGAQADGSSITRARRDLTASELMPASHARGLLWQGHEWEEIWMTLSTTGDRNSHFCLQLLEVDCNPRNWRSQRNLMKLWIVEGLYKYCLFDFF